MSAFARGFSMGGDMYQRGLDNKRRKEKDAMEAEAHRSQMEERRLRTEALERTARKQSELDNITADTAAFTQGIDRQATNANLDADFEQAYQATGLGLPMPEMAGGSNMANQQALTARHNLDPNSIGYQLGLNQLAQRYATVSGDMDKLTTLAGQGRGLSFQEAMNTSRQEFMAMTPEQRTAFLESVTEDAGIPFNVMPATSKGKDGKPEYMVWVEGKPRVRVDDATLSDIYAAGRNLGTYGDLARDFMSKGNDKIRQLFKDYVEVTDKVVDTNNQAARYANADANDAARTRISQQQANQTGEYYRGLIDTRRGQEAATAASEEFQRKVDGVLEGYQAAMAGNNPQAAQIYAREYDQLRATTPKGLRVPPALSALTAAQRGTGIQKPTKVEDAGVFYRNPDGTLFATDGLGGQLAVDGAGRVVGVPPQERAVRLAEAGVPPEVIPMVRWTPGGEAIMYRGMEFDPNDPAELRALRAYALRQAGNDEAVSAAQRDIPRPNQPEPDNPWAFGPRITFPYDARKD